MNSIKKTARIAGFLYLMYFVTTILAQVLAHLGFGDAAEIVNTMMAFSVFPLPGLQSNNISGSRG
jgi:hypothetical protein